ncbi:glucan 1,3 beta-glucosidase [Cyathus striatus]|nr:glucan 1,3 beta-glucosidase [Cyathus striatus]
MSADYQTLGGMSHAFEKQQATQRRSKWIVVSSLLGLLVLIAAGVAVGIIVSKNNSTSSSTSNSTTTTKSNSTDPSVFTKDSKLHVSFYGMAYTPEGSLMPDCGNSLENVIQDIQLLSQLTTRIRLYGADCNQSALVLEAIKQTKVDIKVYLGNYVVADDSAAYERQRETIKEAILTYGTDNVAGVTVGNEFMLNYVTAHSATSANDAIAAKGAAILLANIQDTRDMLTEIGADGVIQVGNSDAGSFFNTEVLSAVDYGLSNVHPWFANTTAEAAAAWVFNFFDETNVQPAAALSNTPKMYIAETGWPTASSDTANANNGGSDASLDSLQIFLDTFVCQANENNVPYFYFELVDEKWKDEVYGGVEGWWGLFNDDRTLKISQFPTVHPPEQLYIHALFVTNSMKYYSGIWTF